MFGSWGQTNARVGHRGWTGSVRRWQPVVIGFDLDMTLIDSRAGVRAAMVRARRGDRRARSILTSSSPGSGLRWSRSWRSGSRRTRSTRSRTATASCTPSSASKGTLALPGAAERLDAVHAIGGRTLVVTAKYEPNAWRCLEHTEPRRRRRRRLAPRSAEGRDARGARRRRSTSATRRPTWTRRTSPDAIAVGVPSGPFSADELARRRRRRRARVAPRASRAGSLRARSTPSPADHARRRRALSSPPTRSTIATKPTARPATKSSDAGHRRLARAGVHHGRLAGRNRKTRGDACGKVRRSRAVGPRHASGPGASGRARPRPPAAHRGARRARSRWRSRSSGPSGHPPPRTTTRA